MFSRNAIVVFTVFTAVVPLRVTVSEASRMFVASRKLTVTVRAPVPAEASLALVEFTLSWALAPCGVYVVARIALP
jgi:hypothetical protein